MRDSGVRGIDRVDPFKDFHHGLLADIVVDMYLPGDTSMVPLTIHNGANQTNYVSSPGDHTGVTDLPVMTTMPSWLFLARVEVLAPREVGVVVTLGDSITDGTRSTPDTNNRWPDHLARRRNQRG